jgi:hypothetical protein
VPGSGPAPPGVDQPIRQGCTDGRDAGPPSGLGIGVGTAVVIHPDPPGTAAVPGEKGVGESGRSISVTPPVDRARARPGIGQVSYFSIRIAAVAVMSLR